MSKIKYFKVTCKCKLLRVILFTLSLGVLVPSASQSAFDAPNPNPINFGFANLLAFEDYIIVSQYERQKWSLSTGGARLYGMPEIQPFQLSLSGPGLKGRIRLSGYGMQFGAYSEFSTGFAYERNLYQSISVALEFSLLQLAIKDYGSALAGAFNARMRWQVQPQVELAGAVLNINRAHIGAGGYPLPQTYVVGSALRLVRRAQFYIELEKDTRYPLQSRFAMGYDVYGPMKVLFGFQSDPSIISTGLSFLVGEVRATAAFQYHPDLGISQCYGLLVSF